MALRFAALLIACSSLFTSVVAHADVLRVMEGPRQRHDKRYCQVYRPVWDEFNRTVEGVGDFSYGPEAPIPNGSADNVTSPEEILAYDLWAIRASLHTRYVDTSEVSTAWTAAPIIGYDQFYAAFSIAAETQLGQVGPKLYPPRITDYPHDVNDYSSYRTWRIAVMVYEMSWRRTLSLDQLDRIEKALLAAPTCGGAAY